MGAIVAALGFVLQKFVDLAEWIGQLFQAVFEALFLLLSDVACAIFDALLGVSVTALGAFDFSGLTSWAGAWAGLPSNVLEVMSAVGVSTAFGIVASAIVIRMGLQLIPFVRLGS